MVMPRLEKAQCCRHEFFLSEIFPLSPEKSLFTWPATFMPQPSFLSRLPAIVATRAGSKHFRRATHRRDFIENGQSVLPPTLPANLFEKNLLKNARDAVTSPIVDTPWCTLRQCRSAKARPDCFCRSMQKPTKAKAGFQASGFAGGL